jgi:hypothetical protein
MTFLLLLAGFLYVTRESDPVYDGQRLSEHLKAFERCGQIIASMDNLTEPEISFYYPDQRAADRARLAVDKVGVKALPMLARMLKEKNSRIGSWIQAMAEQHRWLRRLVPHRRYDPGSRRMAAVVAYHFLGPKAASAIPRIIPLLRDPECAQDAAFALRPIRPEREKDLLSLTNVLNIPVPPGRSWGLNLERSTAILILASFGTRAGGAIPTLMECLRSTNEWDQGAAAVALVKLGAPAEKVVPLILRNLPQTNPPPAAFGPPRGPGPFRPSVHDSLIHILRDLWALGEYGGRARMALPILTNLQSYPVANIQEAARATAKRIRGDTNLVAR